MGRVFIYARPYGTQVKINIFNAPKKRKEQNRVMIEDIKCGP